MTFLASKYMWYTRWLQDNLASSARRARVWDRKLGKFSNTIKKFSSFKI
jgi:hypothetical protein